MSRWRKSKMFTRPPQVLAPETFTCIDPSAARSSKECSECSETSNNELKVKNINKKEKKDIKNSRKGKTEKTKRGETKKKDKRQIKKSGKREEVFKRKIRKMTVRNPMIRILQTEAKKKRR